MKNKKFTSFQSLIIAVVITTIIAGGIGFGIGNKYPHQQAFNKIDNQIGEQRNGNNLPARDNKANNKPMTGTITDQDETSITIKTADGGSKIILLSESTTVNKIQNASIDELITGEDVSIFGQENTDGSLTAQSIQLGAEFKANN